MDNPNTAELTPEQAAILENNALIHELLRRVAALEAANPARFSQPGRAASRLVPAKLTGRKAGEVDQVRTTSR